jgi:hypothetical protein
MKEGGKPMPTNDNDQATKAEVQTTPANKLPVPGQDDTEFSAEEAAQAFKNQTQNQAANRIPKDQE